MDLSLVCIITPRVLQELPSSVFFNKEARLIKRLLSTAPEFRTPYDLSCITTMLLKTSFFSRLRDETDDATIKECATWVNHGGFKEGEVRAKQHVYRRGDQDDKFYIIIEGSVAVHNDQQDTPNTVGACLIAGQSFGDHALLQDRPRSEEAVCETDCSLAVLNKATYRKVMGKLEDRRLNAKVDFLRSLPVFANWTRRSLSKFTSAFTQLKFPRKKVVFEDGAVPQFVYVVYSGEFSLLSREPTPGKAREALMRLKSRKLSKEVALLGRGEFIGHQNAIDNIAMSYSCKCSSAEGVLWAVESHDFVSKVASLESSASLLAFRGAALTKRAIDFEAIYTDRTTPKTDRVRTPPSFPLFQPFTRGSMTSRLKRSNLQQIHLTLSRLEGSVSPLTKLTEPRRPTDPSQRTMSNLKRRPTPELLLRRPSMPIKKIRTKPLNMHMQALRQGMTQALKLKAYYPFIYERTNLDS
jgi:CRP-like cAMP-binding protein